MPAWDLVFAIITITMLSFLAFLAGHNLGQGVGKSRPWLFLETLTLSLVFSWFFAGRLIWANAIPASGVVYWSNLMPVLLGFTAGLACGTPGLKGWRRPITVAFLALIAMGHLLLPIARPIVAPAALAAKPEFQDGICLQSHSATCGAAATATLLNLEGFATSEQEMIGACLTSRHGTEPLGIYRGLKLATRGSDRQVKVASRDPNRWKRQDQLPNVALVRFANSGQSGSIRWLLGPRGEGHAVVVLACQGGEWIIGDPAMGRVRWSDNDFRRRFTGDAIYLAK